MEKRIIERLNEYMDYKGLNDNKVTSACGLSIGLLGKAAKGEFDLGRKTVARILEVYDDLDRVWLLTGSGHMLKDGTEKRDEEPPPVDKEIVNRLLDEISALRRQNERLTELLLKNGTRLLPE